MVSQSEKMDQILKNQKRFEKKLNSLIKKENTELTYEASLENKENQELKELEKLEVMEKKLEEQTKVPIMTKVTLHDVSKAIVGTFVGIIGHFALLKGIDYAHKINMPRAIAFLLTSYVLINLILYFSGFRKIKQHSILAVLPYRATVIYVVSLIVIILTLILFGYMSTDFSEVVKQVATLSILGALGAGAADLLGRE